MVSAGRILILPKGAWDNLTSYSMLDLVTASNNIAYLARQASVGVNPISDTTNTYWQPFGSTVQADGETLIISQSGVISLNLDNNTIVYDSVLGKVKVDPSVLDKALSQLTDVTITSAADGDCLVYNLNDQKWENSDVITQINSDLSDKEAKPTVLTATLAAGATTLTFTNAAIGNNSRIRAYSNPFVLGLFEDMTQSGTTVTLTCVAQAASVSVMLEVRN